MGQKEKLIARLKSKPKDFTFDEAETLLRYFGYSRNNKGKTSGSKVEFYNRELNSYYQIHRPHPGNELKEYQTKKIIKLLEKEDLI